MEVDKYVDQIKKIYSAILAYIDNEEPEINEQFKELIPLIDVQNHVYKYEEMVEILQIISKVSKNHHRYSNFFSKIEQILSHFSNKIKETFTNQQIFRIFKNNKRILLFLFKSQIITPNKSILRFILTKGKAKDEIEEEEEEEEEEDINCIVNEEEEKEAKKLKDSDPKYSKNEDKDENKKEEDVIHRKKKNIKFDEEEEEEEKEEEEEEEEIDFRRRYYYYRYHYHGNQKVRRNRFNKNKIVKPDNDDDHNHYNFYYDIYFYPEIKDLINETKREEIEEKAKEVDEFIFTDFEEKRKNGFNESYLCKMIRTDSIEQFVTYVSKTNISLETTIKPSIFETNSILIKKEPTLIEYAAFYGSIQIFRYLQINNVRLNTDLWLYTIHSKNAEMIHLLEENNLIQSDKKEKNLLFIKEAIKCHHNDIANYIRDNLFANEKRLLNVNRFFNNNLSSFCFQFHNYSFYPTDMNDNYIFLYSCQYNYPNLVKLYLKYKVIDVRNCSISTKSLGFDSKYANDDKILKCLNF